MPTFRPLDAPQALKSECATRPQGAHRTRLRLGFLEVAVYPLETSIRRIEPRCIKSVEIGLCF